MTLNVHSSAAFEGVDFSALKLYLNRVVPHQPLFGIRKLETLGYLMVKTASLCVPRVPSLINSEKVQLTRIESRQRALQRAIDQGRASPVTSPKCGSDTHTCRFSHKFGPKTKSLLQRFIV